MTVKELKEKLNRFDDNLIVMACTDMGGFFEITHISKGINEFDGCLFIDDYVEYEDEGNSACAGCVYEDTDSSTEDMGNCVCCSRMVDFAKHDNYKRK